MEIIKGVQDFPDLPTRMGKRPITIRGPLHVQCGGHSDEGVLHQLVQQVIAWPGIEAGPLPIGTADLVSLELAEDFATDDPSAFITGREFGRILFGAPTIYLALPLASAHWAIVRGWAEPHFSGSFGFIPPGVMVVYTPRDEQEAAVCLSLFWISYNFALTARRRDFGEKSAASGASVNRSRSYQAGGCDCRVEMRSPFEQKALWNLRRVLNDNSNP